MVSKGYKQTEVGIIPVEKKLNKTKLLKQGMMQKLLTGEIRLLK